MVFIRLESEIMREVDRLPTSPSKRLETAMDHAWKIVKTRFIGGRIQLNKEAALQHHYAQTLKTLGELYAINRDEYWIVDLEKGEDDLTQEGKTDNIDVICEVHREDDDPTKSAIEMKFKDAGSGAPRFSVQALVDVYRVEKLIEKDYEMGRFYMITNTKYCWKKPKTSVIRKTFGINEGRKIKPGDELEAKEDTTKNILKSKLGKEKIEFSRDYSFEWEGEGEFRYLSIKV